ncbi:MAG: PD-(D/E)XK nuclease family protein [Ilumatobacter sp.]|uniref:PD-(D/E)XK nuclease family protein n=1 Tax=Ilumatobacter sp. TaxID=1967498 RepID=UPI003C794DD0
MIESSQFVPYGRPATAALVAAIGAAQADDPLAPVTVIVPSNFVGLSVRRLVGSDALRAGQRAGLANVRFVTPFQLAEHVAADLLLETRPITNPVLGAAVRRTLDEDPGPYAPVAHHEATEQALAGLFADLSNVDEAALESILDTGSKQAVLAVGFYRSIASRLGGFHTERDLAVAAARRADLAERLEPFGHVVWYLPTPTTVALADFIGRVLTDASSSSVVVGVSGIDSADESVRRTCAVAGVADRASRVEDAAAPTATRVVSVTDAAEEVRETCARILELIATGTPPARIGVFFPTPDPYVRIIEQQFDAADVAVNGPNPRRLADSVAGRVLLGVLDLPSERWRRDRVIALVSAGPLRLDDERVRPTAWDELSRDAGVVADLVDWRTKLDRYRESTQGQLDQLDVESGGDDSMPWRRQRLADRLHDISRLRRFVDQTAAATRVVTAADSWLDRCAAATVLLTSLLGAEHQHSTWPEAEQEAFARVEASLARLATLDDIEPSPSTDVFVRALRSELDVARGRRGRFGHGVMYGPIASAIGHDLDAVFVLGAAEGVLPVPRRDDAILPEQLRLDSLDQLESKSARLHHQHRAFLAALAAAPPGQRTITFPRGSLRSSRHSLPSRWLLDSVSALAGRTVHATDFDSVANELGDKVFQTVASFATGIAESPVSTSIEERDVVDVARSSLAPLDHPVASLVRRGLDMQVARRSSEFTEFDGNLAEVDTTSGGRPVSPSRLETWSSCGLRYFFRYVLDVTDRDDPERTDELSALDRGSLVHLVLERFIDESIENGPPDPSTPWSESDRERLHAIATELANEYEASGRTGRPINWRVQRDDLNDVLDRFLLADDDFRRSHLATPTRVELDLGVRSGEPVDFDLADGRRVTMRGLIDRVDTTADGRVIVSDYKTGKGKKFDGIDDDPFLGGRTLQLGMYSEGAMRHTQRESAAAAYWLVESNGQQRLGYAWNEGLRARFDQLLAAITDGIDGGVFAAAPGEWNTFRQTNEECTYCDYDPVCVRERGEQADAKAAAPEVQVRLVLEPTGQHVTDES